MSTRDGAIGQKFLFDLEWIYYGPLPNKKLSKWNIYHQQNFINHSQHKSKQQNRYSSIINYLKYE